MIVALILLNTSIVSKLAGYYFGGITTFIYMLLNIAMVILFIMKMVQIYKNISIHQNKEEIQFLIEPVTKVTILSSISLFFTTATLTLFAASHIPSVNYVQEYVSVLDLYTNFGCVILCDKSFKNIYEKLFGKCLANKCNECWMAMVVGGDNDKTTKKENQMEKSMNTHMTINSEVEITATTNNESEEM